MTTRKTGFANGEYYHIFNRGVDKRAIFADENDRGRFFKSMLLFNAVKPIGSLQEIGGETANRISKALQVQDDEKLVDIICYCLNPNHFHFILEQLTDGGISEFMKRIGGYTWYFNNKYQRNGSLFQGVFKSAHIDSNEYLLHVSSYVNLNDRVHRLNQFGGETAKLVRSKSSWQEYINPKYSGSICKKDIILGQFQNIEHYKSFAESSLEDSLRRRETNEDFGKFLLE